LLAAEIFAGFFAAGALAVFRAAFFAFFFAMCGLRNLLFVSERFGQRIRGL